MKKTLFLLCSTMLLWMGCTEDDSLKNENLGFKTIGAVIEQGNTNSRVQVNDNNSGGATLSWVTDDAFKTFGDITAEYKYNGSVFNVVGDIPQTISYAVYPSSYNPSISGTTLTLELENSFSNKEKESKLPMWAGAPVSNQLSFKHLAALLKIDLTGIAGYTSIEVTADKAIAGNFTADLTVENPELSVSTGNTEEANKTVTITLTGNTTGGAEAIYLPIPAATYGSLTVTAKGNGVEDKLLKSWTGLTFERAKMYTASIANLSTPSDVTSALENLSITPVVLNLVDFTTDENDSQITIPNVVDSDLTLNFVSIPTTTEGNPLVIESENETNVGEATKELTINIPAEESGEDTYLTINTPTTTVTVAGGNYATLTATTATNTLIIKSGVEIANLVINGGHVVIEEGAEVTSVVASADNTDVVYVVDKRENSTLSGEGVTVLGSEEELELRVEIENNTTDTYTLTENLVLTVPIDIPSNKSMTIDLNGYSITAGSNGYVLYNQNGGTLQIIDPKSSGQVYGVVYTGTGSNTIIDGGTYNAVEGGKYVLLNSGGSLTINKAVVYGGSSYPIYSYDPNHQLTIEDVTVHGIFGCVSAYGAGGKVEINGGTFEMTGVEGNTSHIAFFSTNSEVIIKNGTFAKVGDVDLKAEGGGGICAMNGAKLTIEGGTFKCADQGTTYGDVYNYGGTGTAINIMGGTYLKEPTFLSEGYKAAQNADGTWTVTAE